MNFEIFYNSLEEAFKKFTKNKRKFFFDISQNPFNKQSYELNFSLDGNNYLFFIFNHNILKNKNFKNINIALSGKSFKFLFSSQIKETDISLFFQEIKKHNKDKNFLKLTSFIFLLVFKIINIYEKNEHINFTKEKKKNYFYIPIEVLNEIEKEVNNLAEIFSEEKVKKIFEEIFEEENNNFKKKNNNLKEDRDQQKNKKIPKKNGIYYFLCILILLVILKFFLKIF